MTTTTENFRTVHNPGALDHGDRVLNHRWGQYTRTRDGWEHLDATESEILAWSDDCGVARRYSPLAGAFESVTSTPRDGDSGQHHLAATFAPNGDLVDLGEPWSEETANLSAVADAIRGWTDDLRRAAAAAGPAPSPTTTTTTTNPE
jgi:hypothetical protein